MLVYKITGPTGKIYIGSTKQDLKRRMAVFKCQSKYFQYPIYKDMAAMGFENFKFEVVEECSELKELRDRETFHIQKTGAHLTGYNLSPSSDSTGIKRSKESKRKNSETKKKWAKEKGPEYFSKQNKKALLNPEVRKRMSDSAKKRSTPERMRALQALSVIAKKEVLCGN
jgi:group I intron endonuclease